MAIRLYDQFVKQHRSSPLAQEASYWKGVALLKIDQFQQAINCWQTLIEQREPSDWKDDALLERARTQAFNLKKA